MKGLRRKVALAWHVFQGRQLWRAWGAGKQFDVLDPAIGPVLILAPHPDDEIIGCGTALLIYQEYKTPVRVGFVTDGRRAQHSTLRDAELAGVRMKEASRLCAEVGAELAGPAVPETPELLEAQVMEWMADLLARMNPAVVYAPFPVDTHLNHRQVSSCLARVLASWPALRIRWYELNIALTPLLATTYCETRRWIARRWQLADLYPSQSHIHFDRYFTQLRINAACVPGSRAVEWYAEIPANESIRWVQACEAFLKEGCRLPSTMSLRHAISLYRQLAPCYEALSRLGNEAPMADQHG